MDATQLSAIRERFDELLVALVQRHDPYRHQASLNRIDTWLRYAKTDVPALLDEVERLHTTLAARAALRTDPESESER